LPRRLEREYVLAGVEFDHAAGACREWLPVHRDGHTRRIMAGGVFQLEGDRRHRLRDLVEMRAQSSRMGPGQLAATQTANCTRASRSSLAWRKSWPDSLAAMHSTFVGAGSVATDDLAALAAAAATRIAVRIRAARDIVPSTASSRLRDRPHTAGYS